MDNKMPKNSSAPKPESKPVLLVEDYESNILIMSLYLEGLGYKYEVARNGNEAFEKFKSGKYSVILMDVQMPFLNGIDATRLIREYERKENLIPTSIIGLTVYALLISKEQCLDAGMDDYIPKPINLVLLKAKLEHFIKLSNERS